MAVWSRLALACLGMFVCLHLTASRLEAQDEPPIVDLLSRDRALGPGCNQVGLAIESGPPPVAQSEEWFDDHAACLGDDLRLQAFCWGHFEGDYQFELCGVSAESVVESQILGTVIHDPSIGAYDPHYFDSDYDGIGCESS